MYEKLIFTLRHKHSGNQATLNEAADAIEFLGSLIESLTDHSYIPKFDNEVWRKGYRACRDDVDAAIERARKEK